MKRIWFIPFLLVIIQGTNSSSLFSSENHQEMDTLTLLYTSDFHGHTQPIYVEPGNATSQTGDPGRSPQEFQKSGKIGGFAYLSSAVKRIRNERGAENVILLHSGDTFSDGLLGNRTQGEAIIRFMNQMGFHFAALGNHDFDYGRQRTEELQRLASFPMRGANIIDSSSDQHFLGEPFLILQAAGYRVGVLALGYHNTHLTGNPDHKKGLQFQSGIDAARMYVPKLREDADVVVVLSHQGTRMDEELAKEVSGIDLIVGGHSHDAIEPATKVSQTWMLQALSDTTVLGEARISMNQGKIEEVQGKLHFLWNDEMPPDPQMEKIIEEQRAPYEKELTEIIAVADERIGRQYMSESPFDKLVGQILCERTNSEISLLPGVGYGVTLPKGSFTRENLYSLLPHPSKLVTLKLTGQQILEVLKQSAANLKPENPIDKVGGLLQTYGMRWSIDLTQPIGSRIHDVYIGSKPIRKNQSYTVATHSGMLVGIHNYSQLSQGSDIQKQDAQINQLVEEWMQNQKKIRPPALGDIQLTQ